jgi:hypothetical protein
MRRCSSCRCVALSAARTPGHFKRLGYASPGGPLPGPWLPLAVLPLPQPPAERHLPPRVRVHTNRSARKVDSLRSILINFFLPSDPIGCCNLQVGMNGTLHAAATFLSSTRYGISRLDARGRPLALMDGSRNLHVISRAQGPKRACLPDPATCRRWHPAMARLAKSLRQQISSARWALRCHRTPSPRRELHRWHADEKRGATNAAGAERLHRRLRAPASSSRPAAPGTATASTDRSSRPPSSTPPRQPRSRASRSTSPRA